MGKWMDRFVSQTGPNTGETIGTRETNATDEPPIVPTVAIVTPSNLATADDLRAELAFVQAQYQACLNVRKSPEYRTFSDITLKHEAMAFARLEARMQEIQALLALV